MLNRQSRGEHERGQIIILFALVLVVIVLFAGIVVDLGMLRNDRQTLVNTMDAAALAGGTRLPVDGSVAPTGVLAGSQYTLANALIASTISANYPTLSSSDYTITYKCLIGIDSSSPPQPYISRDVPAVCDPHYSLTRAPLASDFVGAGATRVSSCDPRAGDKCNVVVVTGTAATRYVLGPVVGIMSGSTGAVQSAACKGPCGDSPLGPVDVMLIMDRSGSMSGVDTTNALAAANSIRKLYKPAAQWLGLGLLGPSQIGGTCLVTPDNSRTPTANQWGDLRRWVPIALSGTGAPINQDYTQSTSTLAKNLVFRSGSTGCYADSSTGTNLKDPIPMAVHELLTNGRGTSVHKGIIFETDGQPNTVVGSSTTYCLDANTAATAAKNAGIEMFTIGFGLDGSNNATCPDSSGAFKGKKATFLLASMASPDAVTNAPSSDKYGCPGSGAVNTNNDGDHFFCLPKTTGATTDLSKVFTAVASTLATGVAHLVQLYPTPIVTSIGYSPVPGPKAGGNIVTITGEFLSGATSVTFGGTAATLVTVVNDTTITARAPAGPANATVNVIVTTGGGVSIPSPTGTADDYKYGP
jgi:hypothetical protein